MATAPEIGRATHVEPTIAVEAAETERLYEHYSGPLFGFCLHRLGSREEAEDAVQTTFLNAFRGLKRGITPEAESAWLFKIAHNVCLTRRRSSYRRGRVESPSDIQALQDFVAAPARMGTEELIELQEALAAMPSNQRKAILLREWQGFSYAEIAAEMDVSQSAVEALIFRARRSLAKGLEQPPQHTKRLWARLRHAFDAGSLIAAAKGLLVGGAAVKAVATAATVTTVGVVATVPSGERSHPPRGEERPATPLTTPQPSPSEAGSQGRSAGIASPSGHAGPRPEPAGPEPAAPLQRQRRAQPDSVAPSEWSLPPWPPAVEQGPFPPAPLAPVVAAPVVAGPVVAPPATAPPAAPASPPAPAPAPPAAPGETGGERPASDEAKEEEPSASPTGPPAGRGSDDVDDDEQEGGRPDDSLPPAPPAASPPPESDEPASDVPAAPDAAQPAPPAEAPPPEEEPTRDEPEGNDRRGEDGEEHEDDDD